MKKKRSEWKPDMKKYDRIIKTGIRLMALSLAREIISDYFKYKDKVKNESDK